MKVRSPSVSVCLPVYNGEKFISLAIRSILQQTLENIELVISDNASTDATADICRDAAARDRRVRYFRAETNRGLAWNHNRAFELTTGDCAMWLGHDDLMAETYLSKCVSRLADEGSAVLCFTDSNDVDESGTVLRTLSFNYGESSSASLRYRDMLRFESRCDIIFGVIRADVLRQTRLHGAFYGSDWTLLAELALRGQFRHISEPLLSRRYHASQTSRQSRFDKVAIFDPEKTGQTNFPFFQLAAGFHSAARRAPISGSERIRCLRYFSQWCWGEREYLCKDIAFNIDAAAQRHLPHGIYDALMHVKRRLFKRSWV